MSVHFKLKLQGDLMSLDRPYKILQIKFTFSIFRNDATGSLVGMFACLKFIRKKLHMSFNGKRRPTRGVKYSA